MLGVLISYGGGHEYGLLKGLRVKGSCGGVTGECTVCGKNNAKKGRNKN